jgi:hypothetical protein
MKAIVQERFGVPDVLRLMDVDVPEMGASDVLVQVRAAAVNPAVVVNGLFDSTSDRSRQGSDRRTCSPSPRSSRAGSSPGAGPDVHARSAQVNLGRSRHRRPKFWLS